jgi:hypothetical protein
VLRQHEVDDHSLLDELSLPTIEGKNANRAYFEMGVRDMAHAEATYPGLLGRLLTPPVKGLGHYRELMDTLTNAKGAIE